MKKLYLSMSVTIKVIATALGFASKSTSFLWAKQNIKQAMKHYPLAAM
jgi:hypothetical protein